MNPPSRHCAARLGPRIAAAAVGGVVLVVGISIAANSLSQPVVRAGAPTGSVLPPEPKPNDPPPVSPSAPTDPAAPTETPTPPPTASPTSTPTPTQAASSTPPPAFTVATVTQAPVSALGKRYRYVVVVENAAGLDANQTAKQVAAVLNDPRSWTGSGTVRFELVKDPKAANFTVVIGAPQVADPGCAPDAWSCVAGKKLVLGAAGWQAPASTYAGDVTGFQRYLVNNAVGTFLGEAKANCPKAGQPAPVMAPQTEDLQGCTPNPWPLG